MWCAVLYFQDVNGPDMGVQRNAPFAVEFEVGIRTELKT